MSPRYDLIRQASIYPPPKELTLEDIKVDELASELLYTMLPVRKEKTPWTQEIAAADIRAGKFVVCGIPVRVVK